MEKDLRRLRRVDFPFDGTQLNGLLGQFARVDVVVVAAGVNDVTRGKGVNPPRLAHLLGFVFDREGRDRAMSFPEGCEERSTDNGQHNKREIVRKRYGDEQPRARCC